MWASRLDAELNWLSPSDSATLANAEQNFIFKKHFFWCIVNVWPVVNLFGVAFASLNKSHAWNFACKPNAVRSKGILREKKKQTRQSKLTEKLHFFGISAGWETWRGWLGMVGGGYGWFDGGYGPRTVLGQVPGWNGINWKESFSGPTGSEFSLIHPSKEDNAIDIQITAESNYQMVQCRRIQNDLPSQNVRCEMMCKNHRNKFPFPRIK